MKPSTRGDEGFLKQLQAVRCGEHIDRLFLYFAAPILRGAKPAALMTLQPGCLPAWRKRRDALRKATGLRTREIINRRGKVLLLMYDESAMDRRLSDREAKQLLRQYGYPVNGGTEEMLSHLESGFSNSDFPHEIGVFLGYPIADVWGFIANGGRNCVCCRHWKVYHDTKTAREMVRRIDEAQSYAMQLLCRPMPVHTAVNLLKAV